MSDFFPEHVFIKFRDLIYKESGIHFSESNRMILESRLKDMLRKTGIENLDVYFKIISSDEAQLKTLLDAVTTNLTRFFRNEGHFGAFVNYVIPQLVKNKAKTGNKTFKVWSAGCSTGEEPYSIAMVLKEILPADYQISVIGSDISLTSLLTAQKGFYKEDRMKGIPDDYVKKYFENKNGGYEVTHALRSMIKFDYHNLKNKPSVNNVDVVFCRNVLIYFDEAAQQESVLKFWDVMNPLSFLFIGHSESLFGFKTQFEFVKTDWACLYTKNLENKNNNGKNFNSSM